MVSTAAAEHYVKRWHVRGLQCPITTPSCPPCPLTTPSEFGKGVTDSSQITSVRDPWYSLTYDAATESIAAGGALRGALFWLWDGSTQNGGDGVVVGTADSTISVRAFGA